MFSNSIDLINENRIEVSNVIQNVYIEKIMMIIEENVSNEQSKEKFITEGNELHNTILPRVKTKLNKIQYCK